MVPRPARGPLTPAAHPVHELLRALQATREAQERETQRRIAWEQEQEMKYRQRQAEMELQISEMRRQISVLQSALAQNAPTAGSSGSPAIPLDTTGISPNCSPNMSDSHPVTGLFTPQYSMSPAVLPSRPHQSIQPVSPVSPILQNPPSYSTSHFVQGSSTATPHSSVLTQPRYGGDAGDYQAALQVQHHSPHLQQLQSQQYHDTQNHAAPVRNNFQQRTAAASRPVSTDSLPPPQSVTPSPSPLAGSTDVSRSPRPPRSPRSPHVGSLGSRKRSNADISSSDSGSDSDSSESNPRHRIRRVSHHDRRCLTIHVSLLLYFV